METVLYYFARGVVAVLQRLPLAAVARAGRAGGAIAYFLDKRHRHVATGNLTACFGSEKTPGEIRAIALENFKRIGENFACAVRTAAMSREEIRQILDVQGSEVIQPDATGFVGAVGHFGNFELYARIGPWLRHLRMATTYRALKPDRINSILQELRSRSGCHFFERRTQARELRSAMASGGMAVGFLADQHAGKSGVCIPFFGRDCATSTAPAVFALRYKQPLYIIICYRTGIGRWTVSFESTVPTEVDGLPRSIEEIMLDVNLGFEKAIRKDPANWFWVHNRWKILPPRDGKVSRSFNSASQSVQPATDKNLGAMARNPA